VRIALDATYSVDPQPSGIAVYSREILNGLAAAHPEDRFLNCYRPKQIRRTVAPGQPNVSRRLLLPPLPTFRADVFHALNQRVDRRPARRVVCTFHDLFVMTAEYSSADFRVRFTEQARHAAAQADMIIAVSRFTATQVTELLGVDQTRIRVIPHGVTIQVSGERPKNREKLVLFAGALQLRKNIGGLVKAFEQLPSDWQLVLAGSARGYGADAILQQIAESSCRERIQVTGYVDRDRLDELYGKASIFAFPSFDEGFGIPVLEAMAHGVPVVTSNRSALVEVAGDAALLVNPYDTDEIASALRRLIDDPEFCGERIQLGKARAKLYSWERAVAETYRVYKEVQ
jgi:glycosyltransferase involved in cell wall biosynthesis